ncbi:upf0052 domain containing protein [Grosmannia clavigera kw1407]|uniref:Upf0052 domain containing protein n=1 Tax=Grosmannia clavigera (strain kw1407 / UAMH 11150) TaxID=655863 RepID=F0XFN3_GROCL|nr:upf0052 domain containing protein [Grosmannia clavigera kw1407]EFX04195.1 upf0052 domain containing protein [Grosmannia clavigera kw1407]
MATAASPAGRAPNATAKNDGPRRRKLIGQRRRVDDDDGDDHGTFDLVDDDSLTDASAASEDRDAAVDDSDTSNIDDASPTTPATRKGIKSGAGPKGAAVKPEGRRPTEPTDSAATPSAEHMLRGLSISDKTATAANEQLDRDASEAKESGNGPADASQAESASQPQQPAQPVKAPQPPIVSSSSAQAQRRETPYERQRREHDLYKQKRDEDPSFVPNRGAFFMHDHRGAGPAANGFRPFGRGGRGRGRGGYGGLYAPLQGHIHNPADPTINAPWAHDMHDTIAAPVMPRLAPPPRRRFDASSQYGGSQAVAPAASIPTCLPSAVPINRSMSVEKPLGVVTVRVFFPPMREAVLFEKFKVVQYTKLPDHRPPLRRDKAVVIDLPGQPKSQIFPAVDRSFIFIPRALRPNQQRMRGNRTRSVMGSISGFSRQTSMFGGSYYNGSMYSPSIALSRRSSITHDVGRDYIISPAGSAMSRPALHIDNASRPVVRLPPSGVPPPAMPMSVPMSGLGISMGAGGGVSVSVPPQSGAKSTPQAEQQQAEQQQQQQQQQPQQQPIPPSQVPEGSSLSTVPPPQIHPLPQRPAFQESRASQNLPMHQPRPQKAVSVDTIDPQSTGGLGPFAQQQSLPMPFHQQVPIQMASGFPPGEPHQRHPSYPSYTAGTPLSQIPERAIHAAPFQPNMSAQPPMYSQPNAAPAGATFYGNPAGYPMMQPPPQQGFFYPTPPTYSSTMAPSGAAATFVPGGTPQGAGPPSGQPGQRDVGGTPVDVQQQPVPHHSLVAQEANGMVYYYDPSSLPGMSNYPSYVPTPAPPGGFVPGMGGMVTPTPADSYYYPPQPGMVYYQHPYSAQLAESPRVATKYQERIAMDDGTGTPSLPPAFAAAMAAPTACSSTTSAVQAAVGAPDFRPAAAGVEPVVTQLHAPSGLCVFSGGTAANSLVDAFQAVATFLGNDGKSNKTRSCPLEYIIPISDNGGSSSELIRFFGGPMRLIPTGDDGDGDPDAAALQSAALSAAASSRAALRALMEHRLCTSDPREARAEWLDLVEARHGLWTSVPGPTRELIRAVLNTLNLEIVKRARPTSVFNFAGASVGNLFLTGARLFSGSFEAAIYLLSLLCGIPDHVAVVPAISSNFTHHISAGLVDGTTIAGQVNISHPSAPTSLPDGTVVAPVATAPTAPTAATATTLKMRGRAATAIDFEDATLPGSLPVLRRPQIAFSKDDEEDLPARIERVWYINPYGHEIRPPANPKALAALQRARAIVYSIGSLYTSIIPSLVLRDVGAAIRGDDGDHGQQHGRAKVLILNSKLDRETGPQHDPMTAVDFVRAITGACQQSQQDLGPVQDEDCRRYVTHVLHLEGGTRGGKTSAASGPLVDEAELGRLGIRCVAVPNQERRPRGHGGLGMGRYDEEALTRALLGVIGEQGDGL